jgi:hypothetical protein
MVKNDAAFRKFAEKTAAGRLPATSAAMPDEGARLIRAFVAVKSPLVRKAIVAFVENLA